MTEVLNDEKIYGTESDTGEQPTNITVPAIGGENAKKKSKSKVLIILGVIAVVIIGIGTAANWEEDVDYVAMVQTQRLFANSQGINLSYADIFNKYFEGIKWGTRKAGDIVYVDIIGRDKVYGDELEVTISVTSTGNGEVKITPVSAEFAGEKFTGNAAVVFLYYNMIINTQFPISTSPFHFIHIFIIKIPLNILILLPALFYIVVFVKIFL